MKIYYNKKDKTIQQQRYIIDRLKEENECLREQIEMCNSEHAAAQIKLAKQSQEKYTELICELKDLKCEYYNLIKSVRKQKERWKLTDGKDKTEQTKQN